MAIRVKKEEIQFEIELNEKLKELCLQIEMPIEENKNEEIQEMKEDA